jgi:hypothetical protein
MAAIIPCPHCHSRDTTLVLLSSNGLGTFRCAACGNSWTRILEGRVSDEPDDPKLRRRHKQEKGSARHGVAD